MPEYSNLPTPAARSLARYMSELSERYWCAGWLVDWEYMAWRWMDDSSETSLFTDEECVDLAWLSDHAGGWVRWIDSDGLEFVPLRDWLAHLRQVGRALPDG